MPDQTLVTNGPITRVIRSCFILAPLLGLLSSAPVSAYERTGLKPKIEFAEDYYYFGYIPAESIVRHDFWIRNAGNDTLKITKVTPGCGCTTAPLSKDVIPPGDSARLSVNFDPKNMINRMVKEVVIQSNDPGKPSATIKFHAVVNQEHPKVRAKPATLRFLPSAANNNRLRKTLTISNNFDSDIELKVVDYPRELFKTTPQSVKVKSRSSASFDIEQTLIATNESDVLGSITLEFTGPENERITVPLVSYFKRKS